jgi:hypothetical protein
MLLVLKNKQKVTTNCVISYNIQIKKKKKKNIFIKKIIIRYSSFHGYILSTPYEFNYLSHVHYASKIVRICYYLIWMTFYFKFLLYHCNYIYVLEN